MCVDICLCKNCSEMPFYQFNHFTGRLKNSSHIQPLYPITPVPIQHSDSPKMIWDTLKTRPATTDVQPKSNYSTVSPKILAKMKHFQKDMSKPVYLMGGTPDKVLFGVTLALGAVCMGMSIQFLSGFFYKK